MEKISAEKFGISVPPKNPKNRISDFDIIIVPGLAGNLSGARLGRGKGFYDCFLSQQKNAWRIMILPKFSQQKNLPVEPHDEKIDEIFWI